MSCVSVIIVNGSVWLLEVDESEGEGEKKVLRCVWFLDVGVGMCLV